MIGLAITYDDKPKLYLILENKVYYHMHSCFFPDHYPDDNIFFLIVEN